MCVRAGEEEKEEEEDFSSAAAALYWARESLPLTLWRDGVRSLAQYIVDIYTLTLDITLSFVARGFLLNSTDIRQRMRACVEEALGIVARNLRHLLDRPTLLLGHCGAQRKKNVQ